MEEKDSTTFQNLLNSADIAWLIYVYHGNFKKKSRVVVAYMKGAAEFGLAANPEVQTKGLFLLDLTSLSIYIKCYMCHVSHFQKQIKTQPHGSFGDLDQTL